MADNPITSVEQDAWAEIAAAIREGIRKAAALMPTMKPDELKAFVETARNAVVLELDAQTFDNDIKLQMSRVAYGDGG